MAHGAGLMLLPIYLGICAAGEQDAGHQAAAATLAGYAFVQFAWPIWIRQHLIAPAHAVVALDPANIFQIRDVNGSMTLSALPTFSQQGAWVLSSQIIGPSGRPIRVHYNR